ncbi:hypothetical protein M1446_05575 [Candidatus Dependentiae bacterium]|nr:hypothetical protein [Candidatus Dependentiae bacterium]
MNKPIFSYLIIISIFSNFSLISQESKVDKLKKSISSLKAPAKVVGAIGLAGVAHTLCTLCSGLSHDYGHEKVSELTNDRFKIADIVAGPLSGMATAYSLIIASQILEAKLNKQTLKKGFVDGLKKPFTIHKQISNKISETISQKNNKSEPSFKNTFFLTLAALNSGILFREFITGLTPISDNIKNYAEVGDGAALWKRLGFEKDMTFSLTFGRMVSMQLTPLLLATGSGLVKGIYSLNKNKNSN